MIHSIISSVIPSLIHTQSDSIVHLCYSFAYPFAYPFIHLSFLITFIHLWHFNVFSSPWQHVDSTESSDSVSVSIKRFLKIFYRGSSSRAISNFLSLSSWVSFETPDFFAAEWLIRKRQCSELIQRWTTASSHECKKLYGKYWRRVCHILCVVWQQEWTVH